MALEVFTVRMGFYDTAAWSAERIAQLYAAELAKLGAVAPVLPSVAWPPIAVAVTPGELSTLTIGPPEPFEAVSQTRDRRVPYAQDPAKLAEFGRAALTVFTWNVCAPPESLGALRDLFRRTKPDVGALKLSPVIALWTAAPVELAGYPNKPARPECAPKGGGGIGAAFGLLAVVATALVLRFRK